MMRRIAPLLFCVLLLVGCTMQGGYLDVPPSPDVFLPPYTGPQQTASGSVSSVSGSEQEPLLRLNDTSDARVHALEYTGSGRIKDMAYVDGTYVALLLQDEEVYICAFDEAGNELFCGKPEGNVSDWEILGVLDGNVCFYSAALSRTYACTAQGYYIWFERARAATVQMGPDGILMLHERELSVLSPTERDAIANYTLPKDASLLFATTKELYYTQDEALCRLPAGESVAEVLPEETGVFPSGRTERYRWNQVFLHDATRRAFLLPEGGMGEVIADGEDYLLIRVADSVLYGKPETGVCETVSVGADFAFCGNTENGFLFSENGRFYRFTCAEQTKRMQTVLYRPSDDIRAIAALTFARLSASVCGISFDSAEYLTADCGYTYTLPKDELLASALDIALHTVQGWGMPDGISCIYLVDTLYNASGNSIAHGVFRDRERDAVLLSVSDLTLLPELLQDALTVRG